MFVMRKTAMTPVANPVMDSVAGAPGDDPGVGRERQRAPQQNAADLGVLADVAAAVQVPHVDGR